MDNFEKLWTGLKWTISETLIFFLNGPLSTQPVYSSKFSTGRRTSEFSYLIWGKAAP